LAQHYRVPPGFCLTTQAFERARADINPDEFSFSKDRFLPSLLRQLEQAYQRLCERCGDAEVQLAVRSSATDEDGLQTSFAGQHDTYLNVVGLEALGDAVVGCWASAHSSQARAYRHHQGVQRERVQIGVLVQQLVPADLSFVLFSANPLDGNPDEIVLNATWGLGESLVGGLSTPDSYVVEKSTCAVKQASVGAKERMTILAPKGTQEVAVPRALQQRPCLEPAQLDEVLALGQSLEARMGWPVDVEGAFHHDQLHLLQCRPITTLTTQRSQHTP